MSTTTGTWNPRQAQSWASLLGMAQVPLFSGGKGESRRGEVLLDGQQSSFNFHVTEDIGGWSDEESLSWAWSANLNHTVLIDSRRDVLTLRRWDAPETVRKYRTPQTQRSAAQLFEVIEQDKPPAGADVVLHLLRAFRAIRASIPGQDNAQEALRVFNTLLVATKAAVENRIATRELLSAASISEIIRLIERTDGECLDLLSVVATDKIASVTLDLNPVAMLQRFLGDDAERRYALEPDLLLRHASGQLYQEAHLSIERHAKQQSLFPAFEDAPPPKAGTVRSNVRFTPTALARSLAQQALNAFGDLSNRSTLDVLDPACGSGIFLIQVIQELQCRGFSGKVTLRGLDVTPLSCDMARFCLAHACADAHRAGVTAEYDISCGDALASGWGQPDVVLMNPPFVQWETMTDDEREQARTILGSAGKGRIDKAMTFVWLASLAVAEGGAVATVLPTPLLETEAGQEWRRALGDRLQTRLIGRFRGYGYFKGSAVEPSFIVFRKPVSTPRETTEYIQILLAPEGEEDRSLRALRQRDTFGADSKSDLYQLPIANFSPISWVARPKALQLLMERLAASGVPRVGHLFRVQQGALTGNNGVFVVPASYYDSLSDGEKAFFRPTASNTTIKNCRIEQSEYVFYPYDGNGLSIETEEQLHQSVPKYYKDLLVSNKASLEKRRHPHDPVHWWRLDRPREWQWEPNRPKLVSTYFGDRGSFAYDEHGQCAVTQGYAWFWQRESAPSAQSAELESNDAEVDATPEPSFGFHQSLYPWAYLALLNSGVFERLLNFFCPAVSGGQFNLSARYTHNVFIPDLTNQSRADSETLRNLARLGQQIHAGRQVMAEQIDEFAARAYGISLSQLRVS